MEEKVVPTVFVRKATGLVREVGWFTVLMYTLAPIGAGINTFVVQAPFMYPGANVPVAYTVTGIPALISLGTFALLLTAMPRSGGDYIYISRIVHPIVGFLAGWCMVVCYAVAQGLLTVYAMMFLGGALSIYGSMTNNPGLASFGSTLAYDPWTCGGAAFVFSVILTLVALVSTKLLHWILMASVLVPAGGSIITLGLLATTTPASGMIAWDRAFGAGAYNEIVTVASSGGWSVPPPSTSATMMAVIPAIFAYISISQATFIGGEVRETYKSAVRGLVLGGILMTAYYISLSALVYNAYGGEFIAQYARVMMTPELTKQLKINLPLGAPMASTYAAVLTTNPFLSFWVAITASLWLANCCIPFFGVVSRSIFAMAFDRFLPEKLAAVNKRFHTPHWTLVIALIVTVIGIYAVFATQYGAFDLIPITMVWFVWDYLFVNIAGAIMPYTRPELYERGYRKSIAGVPLITILGVLGAGWWFFALFICAMDLTTATLPYCAIVYAIGVFIFVAYLAYNMKKGIDVKTIYSEVPPV